MINDNGQAQVENSYVAGRLSNSPVICKSLKSLGLIMTIIRFFFTLTLWCMTRKSVKDVIVVRLRTTVICCAFVFVDKEKALITLKIRIFIYFIKPSLNLNETHLATDLKSM